MAYGLYFSLLYASDDLDFVSKFDRLENPMGVNQRIVYYTELDDLLGHAVQLDQTEHFKSPLLYINRNWTYGWMDDSTVLLKNRRKATLERSDADNFKKIIAEKYPDISADRNAQELVCQFPLPTTLFKFFYIEHAVDAGRFKPRV